MSEQLQLSFDFVPLVNTDGVGETIQERFEAFHDANPHIYRMLRALALGWVYAGRTHGSMKMFWETLRFQSGTVNSLGEPYKLNNDFTALYARLLMEREPALAGFFEIRERRAI